MLNVKHEKLNLICKSQNSAPIVGDFCLLFPKTTSSFHATEDTWRSLASIRDYFCFPFMPGTDSDGRSGDATITLIGFKAIYNLYPYICHHLAVLVPLDRA